MCKNSCNECCRKIYSTGVAVVTVDDVDTLVITIPQQTFNNCQRGCIVITQAIPATATISMPVAISIGGGTETYPLETCRCANVTASMLRTRRRYPYKVVTNATGGSFRILKNLSCSPNTALQTIPAST